MADDLQGYLTLIPSWTDKVLLSELRATERGWDTYINNPYSLMCQNDWAAYYNRLEEEAINRGLL